MTIATTINRKDYVATAGQTIFPYDFLILADTDFKVYQEGTLLTLTTHYTVSGAGNPNGGNVTLVTGAITGDEIVLLREMSLDQATDYVENDPFPADAHEDVADKLTMIIQQFEEKLGRAIKLAVTSTLSEIALPDPGGGKFIRWNSGGTALELVDVATGSVLQVITTKGDLIQGGTSGIPERLAIGSTGQILEVVAGKAGWSSRLPGLVAESELTISSGNITPTIGIHSVDTESDAASDDLANILTTNLIVGSLLYIRANNTARTIVVKHAATGAGQMHLVDSADLSLTTDLMWILLQRRGADWYEVFRDISSHDVAAAVHGLGASVNVLGDRDGAGRFAQKNLEGALTGGSADQFNFVLNDPVTFAVAFSATPNVVCTSVGSGANGAGINTPATTTGFTSRLTSDVTSDSLKTTYIAIGT